MAMHAALTPNGTGGRIATRETFDAYARCADRRDAEGPNPL
jgi:hypothetical protein